jgi:uncharacterized membrane protein YagU involved in acid resistance
LATDELERRETADRSRAMNSKRLVAGVAGGLVGGVVFGVMMQMMGMLGMVAALVGQEGSIAVGWVVHLAISVAFGLGYAVILGAFVDGWARAVAFGALYGVGAWVAGALVAMPAMMGMPVLQVGAMQLQSLVGHLVYGVVLGAVYQAVGQRATAPEPSYR